MFRDREDKQTLGGYQLLYGEKHFPNGIPVSQTRMQSILEGFFHF
jgi:hypothetical protein